MTAPNARPPNDEPPRDGAAPSPLPPLPAGEGRGAGTPAPPPHPHDAEILTIGSELVTGRILDTNARRLALLLAAIGRRVRRHVSVGDDPGEIARALAEVRAPLCVTTGGLGPTVDDRTREALAAHCGVPLVRHEPSVAHLRAAFARFGRPMPENNLRQALIPAGATVFTNRHGTAPAFAVARAGCCYLALPGVPRELEGLWQDEVGAWLGARGGAGAARTRCWHCFGISESRLDELIADLYEESPACSLGVLASDGVVTVRATVFAPDEAAAGARRLAMLDAELRVRLGPALFGTDETTLAGAVLDACRARGWRLAVAESCTGGLLASLLTDVPGASTVFARGWVVYENAAKEALGVRAETIAQHGAVSAPVAAELAAAARHTAGVELGLATTGIAGPTGGSAEKPVGLCCVAVSGPDFAECREVRFPHDRRTNKDRFAKCALDLARRTLARRG